MDKIKRNTLQGGGAVFSASRSGRVVVVRPLPYGECWLYVMGPGVQVASEIKPTHAAAERSARSWVASGLSVYGASATVPA